VKGEYSLANLIPVTGPGADDIHIVLFGQRANHILGYSFRNGKLLPFDRQAEKPNNHSKWYNSINRKKTTNKQTKAHTTTTATDVTLSSMIMFTEKL
jgi:hypothetical protein